MRPIKTHHKDLLDVPLNQYTDSPEEPRPKLLPLNLQTYGISVSRPVKVNPQFRIVFETNTYSVPTG